METIDGQFYIIVRKRGNYTLNARLTNRIPALDSGEVAIKLSLAVPRAIFEKPQLEATISIPEDSVNKPVIDATVLDNVREVLQQQTGLNITVSLVEAAS